MMTSMMDDTDQFDVKMLMITAIEVSHREGFRPGAWCTDVELWYASRDDDADADDHNDDNHDDHDDHDDSDDDHDMMMILLMLPQLPMMMAKNDGEDNDGSEEPWWL